VEFASLTDLKAHLNIGESSSVDEAELDDILDAATELVQSMVGSFDVATVTETVAVYGGTVLLSQAPTGAVAVVDYYGNAVTGSTVNVTARLLYVPAVYGPVTVTYPAGTGFVPAGVRLATLIIAAHLWETQRGVSPSPLSLQGADVGEFSVPGLGFAIPNRARELLAPYVQSTQLA